MGLYQTNKSWHHCLKVIQNELVQSQVFAKLKQAASEEDRTVKQVLIKSGPEGRVTSPMNPKES